jgi:hypothetical protein
MTYTFPLHGQKLLEIYLRLGLKLQTAENAREAGIYSSVDAPEHGQAQSIPLLQELAR